MTPGRQLTPTLRLVRPLARGSMGSVWVADHLALGTQVAIKFMAPAYAQEPEFVARFRREVTAVAELKSPHAAQMIDHGVTDEGAPYIAMELLEGETLGTRLRRLGTLPPGEVARVVTQAAKALGRAHHLGIVHRDIKPENLFLIDVEGEPFVKVLDFGVAKRLSHGDLGITSTEAVLGTPLYMSPEQLLSSKHVDHRADLWALSVVAYQALTGKLPFAGETLGALSMAVHLAKLTPPSALRPGLPAAIDAWATRALARDPAERFGSAKELADALELAAAGTPPSAPAQVEGEAQGATPALRESGAEGPSGSGVSAQTALGPPATSRRRRWTPVAIIAGVLAGLAVVGGALAAMRWGAGEEPTKAPAAVAPAAEAEPRGPAATPVPPSKVAPPASAGTPVASASTPPAEDAAARPAANAPQPKKPAESAPAKTAPTKRPVPKDEVF
jgi:serine/threonine-protein kinase